MIRPLVSILTPFRNTGSYLPACITSILNQSYDNWELLLVNDSSSDNSSQIVESFAKNDTRIKLLNNHGIGIIHALRLAMANSSGQFITRMDSDDVMATTKLETMVNTLVTNGKGYIALGKVAYFSHTKVSAGYLAYEAWLNSLTKRGTNFEEIYKECPIASPCWMIYKEDLEKCGAFNYNNYPEDYDLCFRFYKAGYKCLPSTALLHHWRDYDTRTSKTNKNYNLEAFNKLKASYFLELDYDDSRPLVVFGAGLKGKIVAKELLKQNILFHWISMNPNKSNKRIYEQELLGMNSFNKLENPQSIITFAHAESQKQFHKYFKKPQMKQNKDYFLFC